MKEYIAINADREGYAPSQCYSTLTVGELIEILQEYNPELPVYTRHDNGHTYGSIDADSIRVRKEKIL